MKKSLLAFCLIIAAVSVKAQDVGQIWIGGNIGYSSHKMDKLDRLNSFTVLPEIGYVINENLGVGINVGYKHQETYQFVNEEANFIKNKVNSFRVAPFLRYTFLKGNIGGLFVDGGFAYEEGKDKSYIDYKTNLIEAGIRPGIAISVSDKVSLIGKFGFLGYKKSETSYKTKYITDPSYGETEIKQKQKTDDIVLDLKLEDFTFGINIVF